MTFLSYAQNFEDVMLWRALQTVKQGFYIDVGAAHPDHDSVTRAFYDRGWRGINVEPVKSSADRIRDARHRDVTLQVALGDKAGTADFFVVDGTGLSTLEASGLPAIGQAGFAVEATTVLMTTLAAICAEYAPADIHFLKIDVEGAEAAVLAGADFVACRPWIVLLEATAPMSTVQTHHGWEPILLSAGYRFVYFDGLNRFYVDEGRYEELAPHFRHPPNVFDDFVRANEGEWARRVVDAQAQTIEVMERALRAERAALQALHGDDEAGRLRARLEILQDGWLKAHVDALEARNEVRIYSGLLDATRASTSWRLTAPLRLAMRVVQRLRVRGREAPEESPPEPRAEISPQPVVAAPPAVEERLTTRRARRPLSAPVLRTVHQFHSGTAVGDAITNAMFLTQALLRQQGFVSEIFAEHVDPRLEDRIRPAAELPLHDNYVLLVRHSMGFDLFDRIVDLSAPKVLMYHNITPPELLAGFDELRHYARLGREQLARWQPRVIAALADSEYNAIELRRMGFANVRASTLLFDLTAMRSRAATPSARFKTDAFTILFVGRVATSKGQPDLVAAYAKFREAFDAPSRLVLVGRHDGPGTPVFDAIERHREASKLGDDLILTGLVSDDDLQAWYGAADLYVSLSRHEGFGVPLVEASAYGVPVLALPTGAVPYTLAGTDLWLEDTSPENVASAMLGLARDPTRRAAIAERQRQVLARFAMDRQFPILLQALAQAGAIPPEDRATIAALDNQMRFAITGHVNGSYSLAVINRSVAHVIEVERPGRVRLLPVEGAPTQDLAGVPNAMRLEMTELMHRSKPVTGPEMVISQHYPVHRPDDTGDVCAALFFWEESRIPSATIAELDRGFDGVLAPTLQVAKALIDSGLSIPVRLVGYVPDVASFQTLAPAPRAVGAPFTFLHVSSGFPRKGIDVLLKAFASAFRSSDAVQLIVKVFPNPHNDIAEQIAHLRESDPGIAVIALIDQDISAADMLALYAQADTLVLPTRGEGFNIPAAEAMAAGIPVIVTGFGGHMDFCNERNARLLAYRFEFSRSHLATPHSVWAEPDLNDLVAALRESVADRHNAATRAAVARHDIAVMQNGSRFVGRLAQAGRSLLLNAPPSPLRILWVSTWAIRCGVAEYSRSLLGAMPPGPEITMFCDERTDSTETIWRGMSIHRTWRQGDPKSAPGLASAIAAQDPDVVVIQHQPALLPWASFPDILPTRSTSTRAVVLALHNTRHILDIAPQEREAALHAMRQVARVLVHTLADLNFLNGLGVVDNVTLMPHGAPPRPPARLARTLSPGDEVIVGCYGFFLPGKGIAALIEALAALRETWPLAILRLVNAQYDTPESAYEIASCRALAEERGVPVEWQTEFLPHEQSHALLAGCDVVALPYELSKESSSAALRSALGAGSVIAVTPLELFDEAGDAVFRFSAGDPVSIAQGLSHLLADEGLRTRLRDAAGQWLDDRSWNDISARLLGMLTGLARPA